MKLKLDENDNVVVIDGQAVYLDDEEKDIVINVDSLYKKIQTVNNESASRKRKIAEMEGQLKVLDGIENPVEWKENAVKALDTVQNLSDKKLIDADKVDELKKQIKDAYDTKTVELETTKNTEITGLNDTIKSKDSTIYNLLVSSRFATSPFFSGKDPKTVLLPDIAESYFGKNFKVEADDNGELIVAGYIGNDRIPSRNNPGENAGFEEAISEIIDKYPMKDRILRAGAAGSGSSGNQGGGEDSNIATLKAKYKDAVTTGNMVAAIGIKNQLHSKGVSVY